MSGARSYWEFYNEAKIDPWQKDYRDAMLTFRTGDGEEAGLSGYEVSELVNAGAQHNTPFAFLLLVKYGESTRVQCYHRMRKFTRRFGMDPTPWDNKVFAFKGDLHHGRHIPTVEWENANYVVLNGSH